VAIALAFGWWSAQTREVSGKSTYDVEGPIDVAYTVREKSNMTAGSNGVVALGMPLEAAKYGNVFALRGKSPH